jgi:hypothetical protein
VAINSFPKIRVGIEEMVKMMPKICAVEVGFFRAVFRCFVFAAVTAFLLTNRHLPVDW